MLSDEDEADFNNGMDPITILTLELPMYAVDNKKFEILETIGSGGFAKVYKGIDKRTGKFVAIKEVFEDRVYVDNYRKFTNEVRTMARCHCCCLVDLVAFTTNPPYSIVTEFQPNNSLDQQILNKKKSDIFTGTRLTKIAMGVAFGMMHVHLLDILHRDLKLSNILLDDDYNPKLCDFGIARFYDSDQEYTRKIGTPIYIAPEVFTDNHYDKKADVYSYAMILFEMAEKMRPFSGYSVNDVQKKVAREGQRPAFTASTPIPLRKLIEQCWDADPQKRPDFSYIYEQFKSGKVSFPNTKEKEVKKYADYLAADALANKELIDQELAKPVPIERIDRDLERKRKKELKEKQDKNDDKRDKESKKEEDLFDEMFAKPQEAKMNVMSKTANNENDRNHSVEQKPKLPVSQPVNPFALQNVADNPFLNDFTPAPISVSHNNNINNINKQNNEVKLHLKGLTPISKMDANNNQNNENNNNKHKTNSTATEVTISSTSSEGTTNSSPPASETTKHRSKNIKFKSEEDIIKELSDERSHHFKHALAEACKETDDAKFDKYARIIGTHVAKPVSVSKLKYILNEIVSLLAQRENLILEFHKLGLYSVLPARHDSLLSQNLIIIKTFMLKYPENLNKTHAQVIGTLLEKSPEKMLPLFSFYAKHFAKYSNPWCILDILLTKQQYIVNTQYGADLARILFYLMEKNVSYAAQRGSHTRAAFIACLDSSDAKTAEAAYNGLMHLDEDLSYIDFGIILKHLQTENLWKPAISLMLRSNLLPASLDLIRLLFNRVRESNHAWIILLRLASSPTAASLFANDLSRLSIESKFNPLNSFKLFVLLFSNQNLRAVIANSSEFSSLMKNFAESSNPLIMNALPSIITRSPIDISILIRLQESGFLTTFIRYTITKPEDVEANNSLIVTLDCLGRIGYCREYIDYFKSLVGLLKEPRLYTRVLTVICTMSFHIDCAKALIGLGLVPYFTSLKEYPRYESLAATFLKNTNRLMK